MPVEAQTGIDQWLVFDSETESEVPELALLSASADAIEIQAIMPGARLGETNIAGQNYLTLSGEGYGVIGQVGAPALPVLRKMVEIPLESDVSLELLQSNTTIISLARLGVKGIIAPVQPSQPKCGEPKPAVSATDTLYGRGFSRLSLSLLLMISSCADTGSSWLKSDRLGTTKRWLNLRLLLL